MAYKRQVLVPLSQASSSRSRRTMFNPTEYDSAHRHGLFNYQDYTHNTTNVHMSPYNVKQQSWELGIKTNSNFDPTGAGLNTTTVNKQFSVVQPEDELQSHETVHNNDTIYTYNEGHVNPYHSPEPIGNAIESVKDAISGIVSKTGQSLESASDTIKGWLTDILPGNLAAWIIGSEIFIVIVLGLFAYLAHKIL